MTVVEKDAYGFSGELCHFGLLCKNIQSPIKRPLHSATTLEQMFRYPRKVEEEICNGLLAQTLLISTPPTERIRSADPENPT